MHIDPRRTLVFFVRDNEVLLAMKKRGHGNGLFNGVGGKLEAGETCEQAAIREAEEEVGLTPIELTKAARLDFDQVPHLDHNSRIEAHVYLCRQWQGEPVETEEMAPQWFKLSEVPYDRMWEDDQYWLPQVLDGETIYGDFLFDDDFKLTKHNVQPTSIDKLAN